MIPESVQQGEGGDRPAAAKPDIAKIIDEHGPKIYALALRLCGNRADAEDLVQEVFMQAYRKWSTFEGRSSPSTWLYTIAVRACRRRMRREKRRRMPALSEISPFTDQAVAVLEHPLARQVQREAAESLEAEIAALPPEFRLPLVFKDVLELSLAEVGEILNIKPQTVKTRVHRARMMLRKKLMEQVPTRRAPEPMYERQVCADLLRAKLEAMDRGRHVPIGQDVICERCRAVFEEFDLGQDLCALLGRESFPPELRRQLLEVAEGGGAGGQRREGKLRTNDQGG